MGCKRNFKEGTPLMCDYFDAEMVQNYRSISISEDKQGLCLLIESAESTATVSLFGGQLLSFVSKKDGRERLWLSEKASFDSNTPIRGGIPICWPWFSEYKGPALNEPQGVSIRPPNHGFVRSQFWKLKSIEETPNDDYLLNNCATSEQTCKSVKIDLVPNLLGMFGYSKALTVTLQIELSDKLQVTLITQNESQDSVTITQALHTYFAVPDISQVEIKGINTPYFDKPTNTEQNPCPTPYLIVQEIDRVHPFIQPLDTPIQKISLNGNGDPAFSQNITQIGHNSVVVWNPWQKLSSKMPDMADEGYKTMLCVEAANIKPLTLKPGDTHRLTQVIT
jgi:glucose-6-phosphate 1-epimerase